MRTESEEKFYAEQALRMVNALLDKNMSIDDVIYLVSSAYIIACAKKGVDPWTAVGALVESIGPSPKMSGDA